jgi:predicted DNA-binding transcriptional regulator YafY
MRADRLLSLLMLLQARGRMIAAELAGELEVSIRTVYRDIEALGVAGVPLYTESGPGGGCALVDGYRTALTGLTGDETRALFMLNIPTPLAQLGVGEELKNALLKLAAALPDTRRGEEGQARNRVHIEVAQTVVPLALVAKAGIWHLVYADGGRVRMWRVSETV